MSSPLHGRVVPRVAVWRLVDPDFLFHDFGDGWVVYSPASGNTHLVQPSHVDTLRFMLSGPVRTEDVVSLLRGRLELPDDEPLDAHVNLMMALLRGMELVEPAPT